MWPKIHYHVLAKHLMGWATTRGHFNYILSLFGYFYAHTILQPHGLALPSPNISTTYQLLIFITTLKIHKNYKFIVVEANIQMHKESNSFSDVVYYMVTCIKKNYCLLHFKDYPPLFF